MFLVGAFNLSIDPKNRLSIPFAIRRKLSEERDGHSFYVLPGRRPGTLALYAEKYYERIQEHQPADDRLSDAAYAYRQFEFSQSALLDPDGQGRILIPERLLKRVGLGRHVVLIAVRDHLELWRPEDFAAFEESMWPDYPQKRARAMEEVGRLSAEPARVQTMAEAAGASENR